LSIVVHQQLSHNGLPMDGALVGAELQKHFTSSFGELECWSFLALGKMNKKKLFTSFVLQVRDPQYEHT